MFDTFKDRLELTFQSKFESEHPVKTVPKFKISGLVVHISQCSTKCNEKFAYSTIDAQKKRS